MLAMERKQTIVLYIGQPRLAAMNLSNYFVVSYIMYTLFIATSNCSESPTVLYAIHPWNHSILEFHIAKLLWSKKNPFFSGFRPTLFFSADPVIFSTRLTVRPYFLEVVAGCSYSVPKWRLLSH